jgi:hypothetical protein
MKYAVIIDSYPSSDDDKNLLLKNLKILKSQNIDVILTSHHPCNSEIIENCDYFLFEKSNHYYFHDSHIINENLKNVSEPIFQKYFSISNITFFDKIVLTGWSVGITSQFFNAISLLYTKGYQYAFYVIGDCIIQEDFNQKLQKIIDQSIEFDNYFIENSAQFANWYLPHFFGFSVNKKLLERIPKGGFSKNTIFQKYYPNNSFEDILVKLFDKDKNNLQKYQMMDEIFSEKNWNLSTGSVSNSDFMIHYTTTSSIFCSDNLDEFILVLQVFADCGFNSIDFEIQIYDENNHTIYSKEINLNRGVWYMENINHLFDNSNIITFNKKLKPRENETIIYSDTIIIKKEDLSKYSILKRFIRNS